MKTSFKLQDLSLTQQNALQDFILHLADTDLILAQRLSALCGHGPILEQDIALTNIALDLIGQAQYYYETVAAMDPQSRSADLLAMGRPEMEYKNLLLVELPNGNYADTVMRQFLFDAYHILLLEALSNCSYEPLAHIAEKAIKEVRYHLDWSSDWVIRLGDGTDESHQKIQLAFASIWPYALECFSPADYQIEIEPVLIEINWKQMREAYMQKILQVFEEATLDQACKQVRENLEFPETIFFHQGGKQGKHSENLGFILTELQFMQKTYPGMEW